MMRRLGEAWGRYWFAPVPLLDLAVARVVIVGTQLAMLLRPGGQVLETLRQHSALPDEMYDALPVLHLLVAPVGWTYRPGLEVLEAVYWVALVTGFTALVGLLTNLSLMIFALGSVFLQAYEYSFGEFHHPSGLMMIALVMLALAPSGRALSLDARRAGRTREIPPGPAEARTSRFAGWPLLVIRWLMALAYFSAAYHKLMAAGLDWMNGYTLQSYILQDAVRWGAPLGLWIGQQFWLILPLSVLTLLWEGTFFLVLVFPALVWIYVPMGLGFHTGTWLTMRAGFWPFMALYAAFIPWSQVYHWWIEGRRHGKMFPAPLDLVRRSGG